ncbi:MAG: MFS transporter [Rhodopila sp.]
MPRLPLSRLGSHRALDLVNFFLADAQTGFGPFVAVYLTSQKWTQVDIGFVLTLGTVTSVISQLPAGALVDAVNSKRLVASGALVAIMVAALLLAIWPAPLPVLLAQILHGFASCVITPAIAAISLGLTGHAALGERLGRNARFASIGNGLAAAVMGATGAWLSSPAVFVLTAVLCVPAVVALWGVRPGGFASVQTSGPFLDFGGLRRLAGDRRLQIFAVCVMLFHLSNAAMLPLSGAAVTMRAGDFANVIIGACIVVPQIIVAIASPWVGRMAGHRGRRWVLLLGWIALPVRGVLLAVVPGVWPVVAVQAVSGISGAVFGVMLPLMAADLSRGSGHFNLCMGFLGLAMYAGAALSTSLAGAIADAAGMPLAFLTLAGIGTIAVCVVWLAMPETAPTAPAVPASRTRAARVVS